MSCKELILFIRTNKGKCIVYVLFGAVITFLLCSVLYLLITVNNIEFNVTDSYTISNGVELQDNNITKYLNSKVNLTANMEVLMVKFSKYKEETSKNLTIIQLDYKKDISEYNEEFSKYKEDFSKYKKGFIDSIKNLTNIVASLRLRHFGDKADVKHNLTFISSQINNITHNFESGIDRLYMLIKSNNKTIHNVLSGGLAYIEKYKNDFGRKINSSLEGSQLFWEKCPIYWKDVGGVYPVKVCEYKQ
tara:strand:- start:26073 stop:26813 length:741 start_codon:yes stop_codon:yes gene_type:complete